MKIKLLLCTLIPISYYIGFKNGLIAGLLYMQLVLTNVAYRFNVITPAEVIEVHENAGKLANKGYIWKFPFTIDPKLDKEIVKSLPK